MKTQTFDIRVALLGYVSAGKSTVLNALLQNKCSEVAMRRTTAGVSLFNVYNKGMMNASSTTENAKEVEWIAGPDLVHSPDQVLRQITEDNKTLRTANKVQETNFNIEIDEPICDMRKDTRLVLIDIPGLNEADSKDVYREYVMDKWDSFDCAIVVMDVFQGVNTEEQVQLLEMVHKRVTETKNVPVIVLCNKVDDPDNDEVMGFVQEISQKVRSIFKDDHVSFIPLSAENAFVYRTASRRSLEEFKKLDRTLVDKIVVDEVGKSKWRKLALAERYKVAYETISDKANFEASLKATNFHTFLESFNSSVGEEAQVGLIRKNINARLLALTFDKVVAHELKLVCDMYASLGLPQGHRCIQFWIAYQKGVRQCTTEFEKDMNPTHLHKAMLQLLEYDSFVLGIDGHQGERKRVIAAMVSLVSQQVVSLVKQAEKASWLASRCYKTNALYDWIPSYRQTKGKLSWDKLSPVDFCTMAQSILLLVYSKPFCVNLGREKILLEKVLSDFNGLILETKQNPFLKRQTSYLNTKGDLVHKMLCEFTKGQLNDNGDFVPKYPDKYPLVAQVQMPKRLSDPTHWGHLAWTFCEFMDSNSAQAGGR